MTFSVKFRKDLEFGHRFQHIYLEVRKTHFLISLVYTKTQKNAKIPSL